MSSDAKLLPDPSEWCAQHLKAIAFPSEPIAVPNKEAWHELTGSDPDESNRKSTKRVDSGIFDDITLTLEQEPFRIVWTATPKPVENPLEGMPNLGPILGKRDWFVGLMQRWFTVSPPIKRLAFAGSFLQLVNSREEAYRRTGLYLPHVEVDPETTDFMYRLNRPRDSKVGIEGLRINRLCTWSSIKFQLLAFSVGAGAVLNSSLNDDQSACMIEVDINTAPEFPQPEIPRDSLSAVFAELVDIGFESAAKGDVRP